VDTAIGDQLLYWQNRLFDARARVIKNNTLLAKIKAEAIEDAHSLAAGSSHEFTAAIAPASRPPKSGRASVVDTSQVGLQEWQGWPSSGRHRQRSIDTGEDSEQHSWERNAKSNTESTS